ncbi:MAG: aldo/keto reductase [Acidobacteria bacterium]|nr:aldo/keto reductase [Acidobacteriota bacterium]
MTKLTRRKFIGTVAAGAALVGGAVLRGGESEAATLGPVDPGVKSPTDRVALGRSGLKVSLVGIGTGSIGYARRSNQTQLGQPAFTKLMRHAFDRGVNFFDLADAYGSHPFFREAMRGVERSRFVVQTKTDSRDPQAAAADVDRFLKELDTDYLDSLIIHCVADGEWTTNLRGVMDVFSEAKRKGKVRAVGVTCHSFEALEAAAASPWVEINQVRWNPRAAHMDAGVETARTLFRGMRAKGQGMVGMKVVGQGDIVRGGALTPADCFRFQVESGVVDAFVVGVESTGQIDELLSGTQLALNELGYRSAPAA